MLKKKCSRKNIYYLGNNVCFMRLGFVKIIQKFEKLLFQTAYSVK